MGTALIYLVVLLVVAAAFFAGASAVFGRGEELAPIPPGATPTWLPDREVHASHVRAVRFQQAVRGYKMAEVDWVLDRLAGELDRHATESESLRRRIEDLESAVAGAKQADVVSLVAGDPGARVPGNGAVTDTGVDQGRIDQTGLEAVREDVDRRPPEPVGGARRDGEPPGRAQGDREQGHSEQGDREQGHSEQGRSELADRELGNSQPAGTEREHGEPTVAGPLGPGAERAEEPPS